MAKDNTTAFADLESANAKIKELETINTDLTKEVLLLEEENSKLKVQTISAQNNSAIVELAGNSYKVNASAFHNEEAKVIVLDKNVLEAKQKIFGIENVRIASSEDIEKLIEENSNLITIIEK